MKLIDSIKEQVSAIVVYKATTFEALEFEFNEIKARIEEGVDKMKEQNRITTVFTDEEITEVNDYARELLCDRYRSAKTDIKGTMRRNFVF